MADRARSGSPGASNTELTVDPCAVDESALAPEDLFCSLASLRYGPSDEPPRWREAADLLARDPGIVDRSIWAAATAGDSDALTAHLHDDPSLAASAGGPFGWHPLTYLCYSRLPLPGAQDNALEAAALLLDAGADPNTGFLHSGLPTPFTALTGVFGEGEQGAGREPRHTRCDELATLLLNRGAHPVDQQTLYNRMFRPDDAHLELLFAHGLADAGPGPWDTREGAETEDREQVWRRQVEWAAQHGFTERLHLLAEHGIDVSGVTVTVPTLPDDPNARDEAGATPLHHAAWAGDLDLIRTLLDAGADRTVVDGRHGTTPREWAAHAYQPDAERLLR
ncbi:MULTISPECIES: ankyrin repeat domain-containing protein [Tsukamurella]|uniref:Ankyrin repeat domain-containing protein n=2 Tax=Tsukamurella TaxID=2060 RepID=A0A5C5S1P5_9ACTN|nr:MULTISPECIES: ankyrin repeat domain-containing protein [Tsukamurella]NMD57195.1 ankyrin repeat domain-containing protein [Tsukamurella columbiensis]TWS29347.1 ankyrin repeat domain-containing protein [Tsukamurella conjunctivitidis]